MEKNTEKCPKCKREWEIPSEQSLAIDIYEMCIVCLVENNVRFDSNSLSIKER